MRSKSIGPEGPPTKAHRRGRGFSPDALRSGRHQVATPHRIESLSPEGPPTGRLHCRHSGESRNPMRPCRSHC
ncbi:DUF6053 domain-containing protein [Lysobacter enzymogenes]|uniref:DUF6053 domain-containing protein n=1 Tax=Lysobacter enzymogenes TaxID=69 RepID=UPI003D1892A5